MMDVNRRKVKLEIKIFVFLARWVIIFGVRVKGAIVISVLVAEEAAGKSLLLTQHEPRKKALIFSVLCLVSCSPYIKINSQLRSCVLTLFP
jgi:hypothetical protein